MTLYYVAGEVLRTGDLVSIDDDGFIMRYVAGETLPAFAIAARNINRFERISFSQDDDTDLRSRTVREVYQS